MEGNFHSSLYRSFSDSALSSSYYRARHHRIGKSDTKRFWRDPYFLSQPNDNFLSICQFWQKTVLDARLDGFVWKPGDRNCSDGCMTVWHLPRVSLTVCMLTWHMAPGTWHLTGCTVCSHCMHTHPNGGSAAARIIEKGGNQGKV